MEAIVIVVCAFAIFCCGMRYERENDWRDSFVPHRPRLLTSPHWPHRVGDHTRGVVGADSSRGNDVL